MANEEVTVRIADQHGSMQNETWTFFGHKPGQSERSEALAKLDTLAAALKRMRTLEQPRVLAIDDKGTGYVLQDNWEGPAFAWWLAETGKFYSGSYDDYRNGTLKDLVLE